jgi:alcohol dehydrogenase class IV
MALANAGLGAVHGFAAPIGGMFDAPHGAVCAALLPHVFAANAAAIKSRAPDHPSAEKLADAARLLTGRSDATTRNAAEWLAGLVNDLAIPRLAAYGITDTDVDELVEKATRASSMKANPIDLTRDELVDVLRRAI